MWNTYLIFQIIWTPTGCLNITVKQSISAWILYCYYSHSQSVMACSWSLENWRFSLVSPSWCISHDFGCTDTSIFGFPIPIMSVVSCRGHTLCYLCYSDLWLQLFHCSRASVSLLLCCKKEIRLFSLTCGSWIERKSSCWKCSDLLWLFGHWSFKWHISQTWIVPYWPP